MITKQSLARSFFDLCKPNYNLHVILFPTNTNILSLASSTLESCFITEHQVEILPERDTDSFFHVQYSKAAWFKAIYCIT